MPSLFSIIYYYCCYLHNICSWYKGADMGVREVHFNWNKFSVQLRFANDSHSTTNWKSWNKSNSKNFPKPIKLTTPPPPLPRLTVAQFIYNIDRNQTEKTISIPSIWSPIFNSRKLFWTAWLNDHHFHLMKLYSMEKQFRQTENSQFNLTTNPLTS